MMGKKGLIGFILMALALIGFAQDGTIKVKKKKEAPTKVPVIDTSDRVNRRPKGNTSIPGFGIIFLDGYKGLQEINTAALSRSFYGEQGSFPEQFTTLGGALVYPYSIDMIKRTRMAYWNFAGFTWLSAGSLVGPDGLGCKLNGFRFHAVNWGADLFQGTRWADLMLFGGLEYGQLILEQETVWQGWIKYRNPFVALHAIGDLRVDIFPYRKGGLGVSAGFRSEGFLDLSKDKWKTKADHALDLGGTRITGYSVSILVSILLATSD